MNSTTTAATEKAIRKSSPWLVRLGRAGYAAKGFVYVVMGILATKAAFGQGGGTTDSHGALLAIGQAPFGKVLLSVIAIGLLGYAAWQLVSAAMDAERRGNDPTGAGIRFGAGFRGLVYASLGIWTLNYVISNSAHRGNQARSLADKVMDWPGGRWIVIGAGLGIIGYAVYQIYRAVSAKFLNRLSLHGGTTEFWVKRLGRIGITARAIVFGMIGWLLIRAGATYNPARAGGIKQSLDAIAREPKGHLIFGFVAVGLIAFGLFELATARYRIMRAP